MSRARDAVPERAVQDLWARSAELAETILTQDGRRMSVRYPGRPNPGAGPDFLDAVFVTDSGETLRGDVEVHVNARDWYAHGHHTDPNYNGVVLHVVLRPNAMPTVQSSGTSSPSAVIVGGGEGNRRQPASSHESPSISAEALDIAGMERFLSKSRGYSHEMAATENLDQVAYEAIMEALGYSSNRRPFLELARRVPIGMVFALKGEPTITRRKALQAFLAGAGGLLGYVKPAQERAELMRLRRRLPPVRPLPPSSWRFFRVRPANHPVNRVLGAAVLLETMLEGGPMAEMRTAVSERNGAQLVDRFSVSGLIGRGRALDIVVNAVLPIVHAWAGTHHHKAFTDRCLELGRELPPPSENQITREMRSLLGLPKGRSLVSSALRHQGLIHLYRKHIGRISERRRVYDTRCSEVGRGLLAAA